MIDLGESSTGSSGAESTKTRSHCACVPLPHSPPLSWPAAQLVERSRSRSSGGILAVCGKQPTTIGTTSATHRMQNTVAPPKNRNVFVRN